MPFLLELVVLGAMALVTCIHLPRIKTGLALMREQKLRDDERYGRR